MIERRQFLKTTGTVALAATAAAAPAFVQPAAAQNIPVDDLMEPGPLPEMAIGPDDAPATIIEYASMTCGHCASFHNTTLPELKERYIEPGKVRFILREYPLDVVALAAFMLARCVENDRYFAFITLLFERQREWAFGSQPLDSLFTMARQVGMTRATFDECLQNQELLEGINWVKQRADQKFGVHSTPTFFINGRRVRGAIGIDDFERELRPYV
ncbi:MAG: DsbA family protein [Hyphomicrobiales bacterium]|nr:DsbA family protein [Hyphomicrobiales bacterium]